MMKKLICIVLAGLMALSMAACASSGGEEPGVTEPMELKRPDLSAITNWVLTAEYEGNAAKPREYIYDHNGILQGFGSHKASTAVNDLGGKTVRLTAYTDEGEVSPMLSKFEYVYDAKGMLVAYNRMEAISNKLADSFTFEYDDQGRLIKQEKFYMELPQETISYTYDDQGRLAGAKYLTTVYDVTYTYTYGQERWPDCVSYTLNYVKTGNVEQCKVLLQPKVEHDQSHYRLTLVAGEGSEGVTVGKELVIYEELINTVGNASAVRIELTKWDSFQMGWVPLGQYGAMNAINWSAGSGTLVFKPLAAYLAQ